LAGDSWLPRCGSISDARAVRIDTVWFAYDDYDLESVLVSSVLYFPFALIVVVVLGIPTLTLLYPFRSGRWWMPVVAGLILGVPLLLALPGQPTMANALIFVPLTALSALVFWLVWRWVGERECGVCCAARP
jgi:hypothetical protein